MDQLRLNRDAVEWDKLGLFISLVTPLVLGVGAWIIDALNKRKKKKTDPEPITQGLQVDYETDYVTLLKTSLADARAEIAELKQEIKTLESRSDNGNSDSNRTQRAGD
jgi:hypothetical protein